MAEVLVQFSEPVTAKDGRSYIARACGGETDRGMWQGWIEFVAAPDGEPIRSARETTQPNRQDTEYWATGLTAVYLEGALERARSALKKPATTPPLAAAFEAPASAAAPSAPAADAVLNPFSVVRKGEALLRRQLGALSPWHLVNIITAYDLSSQTHATLTATPGPVLVELIISAVAARSETVAPED